jgi:hypothetical protein
VGDDFRLRSTPSKFCSDGDGNSNSRFLSFLENLYAASHIPPGREIIAIPTIELLLFISFYFVCTAEAANISIGFLINVNLWAHVCR